MYYKHAQGLQLNQDSVGLSAHQTHRVRMPVLEIYRSKQISHARDSRGNRSPERRNNLPKTMQKACSSAGCRAGVSDSAACMTVAVMPSVASNDELSTVLKIKCTKCVFNKSVCCHGALIY